MQNLFYNVTGEQTLVWDAPEGRPSAVTSVEVFGLTIGDDGTAEDATTGSGTAETNPSTTFDAAAGTSETDSTLMPLTATTGIAIGRTYMATNAAGETELVEVREIVSGVSASSRHALTNDFAASDTFESTRISIAIDDTWIADSNNITDDLDPNSGYRVRWVYVVDSITRVHDSYFNVVRYRADHDVTPQMMDNDSPGWINSLEIEHREDRGAALVDNGYRKFVLDLHRRSIPAEMLRNRGVVNEMTILRTLLNGSKARARKTGDVTAYEIDRLEYFSALDGLIPLTSTADDTSGAGGPGIRSQITLR